MVDASKILTVSYGTFSCTLEGFDDPFSTMRGIAEYFRDLAADDRYFGAEPPTPDAEMLHRIAEREINKPVEAQVEEDGIILRQLGNEAPAEAVVAPAQSPAAPAPMASPAAQEPPVQPSGFGTTGSVAEKLARIRALSVEDEFESGGEAFEGDPISSAFEFDASEDIAEEPAEVETPAFLDQIAADEEPAAEVEDQAEEHAVDATPDADTEIEAQDAAELTEDTSDDVAEAIDAEPDTAEDEDVADASGDNEPVAELETQSDVSDQDDADQDDAGDADAHDAEDTIASIIGASLDQSEEDADVQDDQMETPDSEAISRVVKMRRSDFDAALDTDDEENLDQVEETPADIEDFNALSDENATDGIMSDFDDESSLSDDDEADLMATLEKVQRQEAADIRSEKEGRAILENQDIESSDDSVSRILDVTNTELEETEGTRRRSAIAHLKAAVAATRADKLLGRRKEEDESEQMDPYRDDLAKVVRPRRPASRPLSAPRRMAPLVLVSEQRVEDEADEVTTDAGSEMVLPRRIKSRVLEADEVVENGDNIFRDGHSFADFAEEMGAKELPDLLEAAAAFSSYVEGREHFSRPQIMKAVASLNEVDSYSREENLRSFGLLLRRGKIKKIKRGQFTIADTTRFNPEVRAVGE